MLWNVPIESLDARYSAQWNIWFPSEFKKHNVAFETIEGRSLVSTIETGAFLDVHSTNYYKATQLQKLTELLYNKQINENDTVFFHDLWFPGLEALQYIRQGASTNFKISGILHAGTYDENDFLCRKGMQFWGEDLENCWLSFIDKIFVATHYHKNLLCKKRKVHPSKIFVTGLPMYPATFVQNHPKENIVVFPHRLDPEKQPWLFDEMAERLTKKYPDWKFISTKKECKTKDEYYALLAKAKIAVSFALQETWGIAQLEALFSAVIPICPNRLSYKEIYSPKLRVNSTEGIYALVERLISDCELYKKYKGYALSDARHAKVRCKMAIPNIIQALGVMNTQTKGGGPVIL